MSEGKVITMKKSETETVKVTVRQFEKWHTEVKNYIDSDSVFVFWDMDHCNRFMDGNQKLMGTLEEKLTAINHKYFVKHPQVKGQLLMKKRDGKTLPVLQSGMTQKDYDKEVDAMYNEIVEVVI